MSYPNSRTGNFNNHRYPHTGHQVRQGYNNKKQKGLNNWKDPNGKPFSDDQHVGVQFYKGNRYMAPTKPRPHHQAGRPGTDDNLRINDDYVDICASDKSNNYLTPTGASIDSESSRYAKAVPPTPREYLKQNNIDRSQENKRNEEHSRLDSFDKNKGPPLPHRQISSEWGPTADDYRMDANKSRTPAMRKICFILLAVFGVMAAVGLGIVVQQFVLSPKDDIAEEGDKEIISCGRFVESKFATVTKESNQFIEQECKAGMSFSEAFEDNVRNATCEAGGNWTDVPDCQVTGIISFPKKASLTVGDRFTLFCQLEVPTTFQTTFFAWKDSTDSDVSHTIRIVTQHNATDAVSGPRSVKMNMTHHMDPVECANEGDYVCGISIGERDDRHTVDSIQRIYVSDRVEDHPVLTMPKYVFEGEEITIQCTGTLGKNSEDLKQGMIVIQKQNTGDFVNITTSVTNSSKVQCHYLERVTVNMVAKSSTDNIRVKCVRCLRGNVHMESESVHLVLIRLEVLAMPENFFVGEMANLTFVTRNAIHMDNMLLKKNNETILNGTVNTTLGQFNTSFQGDDVKVVESDIQEEFTSITLMFDEIYCTETQQELYTLVVNIGDRQAQTSIQVNIFRRPETPTFSLTHDILEGLETRSDRYSSCEAELGTPPGSLQIWSDFDGTFQPIQDVNILGIKNTSNHVEASKCTRKQKITFSLRVNLFHHRKHIRCVVVPAPETLSHGVQLYQKETVKVLPRDYCNTSRSQQIDKIALDPNKCYTYVNCLAELPSLASCQSKRACFKLYGYQCLDCDYCGLTDIYVVDGYKTVQKNSEFTVTCVADGFLQVNNITISKQSTTIATVGYVVDNTLYELVHSNVTEGVLSFKVKAARCSDGGEYNCVTSGIGTRYTDTAKITVLGNDC